MNIGLYMKAGMQEYIEPKTYTPTKVAVYSIIKTLRVLVKHITIY